MSTEPKSGAAGTSLPRARRNIDTKFLIYGALGALLYFGHAAFIPIALALLFSLILSAPVEALHKKRIPRSVSAAFILVLVLVAFVGIVAVMKTPTQEWFSKAPQTTATIKRKIRPIAQFVDHLEDLRKNAGSLATAGRSAPPPREPAMVTTQSEPALLLDVGTSAMAGMLSCLIVTLFVLTGGPPMLARMTAAFVDDLKASSVLNIIEKVRGEVGHFYLTTTLINIGLGTVTGLVMWAWGMPTPYLWGAIAAILNYIP